MNAPRQLAVLRTYADVLRVIRARRDELDVPHEIIDDIAGLPGGYTSKLLTPKKPMKVIGRVSGNVSEAIGVKIIGVEDPHALQRAMRNHTWRNRRQDQPLAVVSYAGRHSAENIK